MQGARDQWSSRFGFVLAASGSAIGLGNLWKFPYVTYENNGGAFILLYLVCIAAVGLPIMTSEILIGRKTQLSAVGAMKSAVGKRWGVLGGMGVFTGCVILGYYAVVAGWTVYYFVKCVGWSFGGYPEHAAAAGFGAFITDGSLQVGLSLTFMALTMAVIYGGIGHGIERVSRVLMPTLFLILLLLLGAALSMEGAGQALQFLFVPHFGDLSATSVLEALGQAFFSLSLGMGAMITYGSYLRRRDNVVRASLMVVVLDTLIAVLAAVIMFTVIFSSAGMSERISGSTAGMLFTTLPELFYTVVPFGRLLAPLFYLLVGFAALTSTISLLEVVVAYFIDERGMSRRAATTLCGVGIGALSVLCGLSLGAWGPVSDFPGFESAAGVKTGLFANLDHLAANYLLAIGGFLITLCTGWIMTRDSTRDELVEPDTPVWFRYGVWRVFIRYITPLAVAWIILAVLSGKDFS